MERPQEGGNIARLRMQCVPADKIEHTHPARLLKPLLILEQKWESISMDFITGLPKVQGRDCLYVVVD